MIDNVTPLRVVALPTADEEAKADAIRILEELLEEAKHGEIVEFAIVIMRPGDDMWDERTTPTRARSAWIGKLMMLMVNWIIHMDIEDKENFNKRT